MKDRKVSVQMGIRNEDVFVLREDFTVEKTIENFSNFSLQLTALLFHYKKNCV